MTRATCCLLAVLIAALPLAGCGNKGALVLPDQQPAKKHKKGEPKEQTPAAAKPADAPAQGPGNSGGLR